MGGYAWRRLALIALCCTALLAGGLQPVAADDAPADAGKAQDKGPEGGAPVGPSEPSARAPGADAREFAEAHEGVACWNDPIDDTRRDHDDVAEAFPRADISLHCGAYDDGGLTVAVSVEDPTDPFSDDNWQSRSTLADWYFDTTGDGRWNFNAELRFDPATAALVVRMFVPDGQGGFTPHPCEDVIGDFTEDLYIISLEGDCLGNPAAVRVQVLFQYDSNRQQPDANLAPVYRDRAPDVGFDGPLSLEDEPEQPTDCSTAVLLEDGQPDVVDVTRVHAGGARTSPIQQAVTMSRASWCSQSARWVVLARGDAFPDALAGSSLGFGGPVLFTHSPSSAPAGADPNRLAPETRAEIQRVLPRDDNRIVYILGGASALSGSLEAEITALGYEPRRLSGGAREDTAAVVGLEARRLYKSLSVFNPSVYPDPGGVLLATRSNWPDAVAAGAMASYWGMPVLLTGKDDLHQATREAIQSVLPRLVYVVGGQGVISQGVQEQAAEAGRVRTVRLAGPTRTETAIDVSREQRRLILEEQLSRRVTEVIRPDLAVAINLWREPDGFAHVLSAATIMGRYPSVVLPVAGSRDGAADFITDSTTRFVCDILTPLGQRIDVVVAGGTDLIAGGMDERLGDLMNRRPC